MGGGEAALCHSHCIGTHGSRLLWGEIGRAGCSLESGTQGNNNPDSVGTCLPRTGALLQGRSRGGGKEGRREGGTVAWAKQSDKVNMKSLTTFVLDVSQRAMGKDPGNIQGCQGRRPAQRWCFPPRNAP